MFKRMLLASALVPVAMIPLQGASADTYVFRRTHNLPLTVVPSIPPSVTYSWTSALTVGTAVSVAPSISQFSGNIFYAFTGALPAGVTFNSDTGVISGTPVAPGSYAFTVAVTDTLGDKAFVSYAGSVTADAALAYTSFPSEAQIGVSLDTAPPAVSGFSGAASFHIPEPRVF